MGAFNEVTGEAVCPACGTSVSVCAQFKYGDKWQFEYSIGDTLRWGELEPKWAVRAARSVRCAVDSLDAGEDPTPVLTGHTPAVRRLLARAATDPKAFELKPMVRVAAAGR